MFGEQDALDTPVGAAEGGGDGSGDGYSTPAGGRAQPLSASSASWVDEMNAELAEFDEMTSGLRNEAAAATAGDGSAWEARLEAELRAKLASPPEASGSAPQR